MERRKIIGFYDYTVILTYLGMAAAFAGILFSINERFLGAVFCLMFAGACDMFDGAVASTKDRTVIEKQFGIQIDSMCDLISFGMLPGIFVYMYLGKSVIAGVFAGIFVLCALIRLAYFNVQELERQHKGKGHRKNYLGLPVTSAALLLPLIYLLCERFLPGGRFIFVILLLLMGAGFLAGIRVKKPRGIWLLLLLLIGIAEAVCIILLSRS